MPFVLSLHFDCRDQQKRALATDDCKKQSLEDNALDLLRHFLPQLPLSRHLVGSPEIAFLVVVAGISPAFALNHKHK
jgi:hypothetical protein